MRKQARAFPSLFRDNLVSNNISELKIINKNLKSYRSLFYLLIFLLCYVIKESRTREC